MGVPGKAECCGSNSACVLLDSAKKARLRRVCALQGRGRSALLCPRTSNAAWCGQCGAGGCIALFTLQVSARAANKANHHAAFQTITSNQRPFLGSIMGVQMVGIGHMGVGVLHGRMLVPMVVRLRWHGFVGMQMVAIVV
jgi:hypothetical protein